MENKPASSLVVSLGKSLNRTLPLLCGRQVAQFSLGKEDWFQEGHLTVKQMPCKENADHKVSAVAISNREKPKDRNN